MSGYTLLPWPGELGRGLKVFNNDAATDGPRSESDQYAVDAAFEIERLRAALARARHNSIEDRRARDVGVARVEEVEIQLHNTQEDEDWTLRNRGAEGAAEVLLKIAQDREHVGVFGGEKMQECADAIMGLHARLEGKTGYCTSCEEKAKRIEAMEAEISNRAWANESVSRMIDRAAMAETRVGELEAEVKRLRPPRYGDESRDYQRERVEPPK